MSSGSEQVGGLGVVVGYDGSEQSAAALAWAAEEAGLRSLPLTVCTAWGMPATTMVLMAPLAPPQREELHQRAEQIAVQGAQLAAGPASHDGPGGGQDRQVRPMVGEGAPAAVLLEAAGSARMVVVASRGRGGFAGLVLGSTALELAGHAPCSVVVVRAPGQDQQAVTPARSSAPVVAGVDGSASSLEALRVAFEEAHLRRTPLLALVARSSDVTGDLGPLVDRDSLSDLAARRLAELTEPWRAKYPQVPVQTEVVSGPPCEVLLEASKDAGLLVLGSRGHGGFRGLLLGSVSRAVLHHASSPVVIVPAPAATDP